MTSGPVGTVFLVSFSHSEPGVHPSFQYSRGCDMRISMPLRTRNTTKRRFR
jgi:hypothetical protein